MVKKPDSDDVRVTIDYRALNAKSKKDAFAAPRIDDLLDKLHGADTFSKIDVKAAYHNIMIAEEDRHKTAFRFDGKLYEWTRTPFGLSSAPGAFNRLMTNILLDMDEFTAVYFDDIIVFTEGKEKHLDHLEKVLNALYKAGMKLNKDKCEFFVNEVQFLGYDISKNSVTVSSKKTDTIRNYPMPKSIKAVKRFLGLTGFYRKFIPNYAEISSPLNDMQCKNAVFKWTRECQDAFDSLKDILCSKPILGIPNPDWTFIVKVDSSKFGVGCILEQENPESKNRMVIEYASRKFTETQRRYPAIELEVCGLMFAVKHWSCYLIGKPFVVETDSKAVQWIKGKRDHLGKLGRWALYLENFQFETVHISGKDHVGPDALSRIYDTDMYEIASNNLFLSTLPTCTDPSDWSEEISNDIQLTKLIHSGKIVQKDNVYVKDENILVLPRLFLMMSLNFYMIIMVIQVLIRWFIG